MQFSELLAREKKKKSQICPKSLEKKSESHWLCTVTQGDQLSVSERNIGRQVVSRKHSTDYKNALFKLWGAALCDILPCVCKTLLFLACPATVLRRVLVVNMGRVKI